MNNKNLRVSEYFKLLQKCYQDQSETITRMCKNN